MGATMKSSVSHLILIVLMLTLLKCVLCYNYGRDDEPTVDQGLNRLNLEDKVEILTNEIHKVYSVILFEISGKDQGESAQRLGITVLEVRREAEGEMIRCTVKYFSQEETVEAKWANQVGEYEGFSVINTAVGNGVYETSALIPLSVPENSSRELRGYTIYHVWVNLCLQLPDEFVLMNINLQLADHKALDREIPPLQLDIEPAGDFVYQEGEEFSFKIRTSRSSKHKGGRYPREVTLYMSAVLLDLGTGEAFFKEQNEFLEIVEKKQFEDYEEVTARIKGTENGVSGLIHLVAYIYYGYDVITSVDITVVLRPSTLLDEPFPNGFLGFLKSTVPLGSGDDVFCNLGENCYYRCAAVGSDITDVTVTRIKADGTYQNLESTIYSSKVMYQENKHVIFQVDNVPEEQEKIRCVVENANGKVISKEVNLVVSLPVDIIEEESGIVLISDTEDAASRTFEISCTVTGSPQPNVTFDINGYPNNAYDQEPDDIIERGNNKNTMIKTVSYNTTDFNCWWFHLSVGCNAHRNSPYRGNDYYSMIYRSNSKNLK